MFYATVNKPGYKEKYEFESGIECCIFDYGTMNAIPADKILEYVDFVYWLYLKDRNPTPLGFLCDYIAERWESVKDKSWWNVLEDFYAYIY